MRRTEGHQKRKLKKNKGRGGNRRRRGGPCGADRGGFRTEDNASPTVAKKGPVQAGGCLNQGDSQLGEAEKGWKNFRRKSGSQEKKSRVATDYLNHLLTVKEETRGKVVSKITVKNVSVNSKASSKQTKRGKAE